MPGVGRRFWTELRLWYTPRSGSAATPLNTRCSGPELGRCVWRWGIWAAVRTGALGRYCHATTTIYVPRSSHPVAKGLKIPPATLFNLSVSSSRARLRRTVVDAHLVALCWKPIGGSRRFRFVSQKHRCVCRYIPVLEFRLLHMVYMRWACTATQRKT